MSRISFTSRGRYLIGDSFKKRFQGGLELNLLVFGHRDGHLESVVAFLEETIAVANLLRRGDDL